MFEKSPDKFRGLIISHIELGQPISRMNPLRLAKVSVRGEEYRLGQVMQDRQQIFVSGATVGDVDPDDAKANSPLTQQEPLAGGKVFVEHQH
jgi:hypothetical protein